MSWTERLPSDGDNYSTSGYSSSLLSLVAGLISAGDLIKPEWVVQDLQVVAKATPSMAVYNNELAEIEVNEASLSASLKYLTAAILKAPESVRQALGNIEGSLLESITKDTNTVDGASRVEPFDLIVYALKSELGQYLHFDLTGWNDVSNQQLSKLSRMVFQYVISAKPQPQATVFRGVSDQEKKFTLLCVGAGAARIDGDALFSSSGGDGLVSTFTIDYTSSELPEKLTLVCGAKEFDVSFAVTPGKGKLPQPEIDLEHLLDRDVLHVATSVSLVSEINANAIVMGVGYLVGHGFIPYNYSWIPDMKTEFTREFVQNYDVFIPASHSFDVKGLGVGSKSPLRVDFFKYRSSTPVMLSVYFPSVIYEPSQFMALDLYPTVVGATIRSGLDRIFRQSNEARSREIVYLKSEEMSSLFCQRRDARRPSAVIFTVACGASSTVIDWMSAYRRSLISDQGEILDVNSIDDVPVVVAPTRGFNTNSSIQILDHLEFPVAFINAVAKGDDLDKVLAMLEADKPRSFMQRVVRGIASLSPRSDAEGFGSYGFQPTSNKQMDWLLQVGGQFRVVIKER